MGSLESLDHRHWGPPDHQLSQGSTNRQCPLHSGSHQVRLSQALETRSTTRPIVRTRFTRSRQRKDRCGKTPRQDLRNQHRTTKRHRRHLRRSCTPASQPQAFSPPSTKSKNTEAKTQRLAAQFTVETELMTATSFEGKATTYLSNFKMKLSL